MQSLIPSAVRCRTMSRGNIPSSCWRFLGRARKHEGSHGWLTCGSTSGRGLLLCWAVRSRAMTANSPSVSWAVAFTRGKGEVGWGSFWEFYDELSGVRNKSALAIVQGMISRSPGQARKELSLLLESPLIVYILKRLGVLLCLEGSSSRTSSIIALKHL